MTANPYGTQPTYGVRVQVQVDAKSRHLSAGKCQSPVPGSKEITIKSNNQLAHGKKQQQLCCKLQCSGGAAMEIGK